MTELEYHRNGYNELVKKIDKIRFNHDHEVSLLEHKLTLTLGCLKVERRYADKLKDRLDKHNKQGKYTVKPKLTGIEKRFQEDMINEMDSQY